MVKKVSRLEEFATKYNIAITLHFERDPLSDGAIIHGKTGQLQDTFNKDNGSIFVIDDNSNTTSNYWTKTTNDVLTWVLSDKEIFKLAKLVGIHISYHDLAAYENEQETK